MIEVYSRIGDSELWQYQTFEDLEEKIAFDRLDLSMTLSTIYDGIVFA